METYPVFEESGVENFPVVCPLSELQHQVSLEEISKKLGRKRGVRLTFGAPDIAITAEIESIIGVHNRSVACTLKGTSILLCIRNSVYPGDRIDQISLLFPPSRIAIKGGLFTNKVGKYGFQAIYVSCPAAVEFLGLRQEELPEESSERSSWLKLKGLSYLNNGAFVQASLCFSGAAEAGSSSSEIAGALVDHALCMYNLRRWEDVIRSCDKALKLDSREAKAYYYKAMALQALKSHREALVNLKVAMALAEGIDREMIEKEISRVGRFSQQQASGSYDLREFFLKGFEAEFTPECGDFISSAIEIRMTRDGRGRGVFLSREVKLGELLMVSNPLVAGESVEALQAEAIRVCCQTDRARRLLQLLPDPKFPEHLPLPGIQEFTHKKTPQSEEIDVQRIKRAVEHASRLSFKLASGKNQQVFVLPALINHSCLPNACLVVVGNALFIRAAKALKAGEEILISYIDCLRPLASRSKMLRKVWGFRCSCRRCEVEKQYKQELVSIPECPMDLLRENKVEKMKDAAKKMKGFVNTVEKLESALVKLENLSDEERGMIQVGYIRAYIKVASNKHPDISKVFGRGLKKGLMSDIEAMKLLQKFVPGYGRTIAMLCRVVRRYVLRLEWHESFEGEAFDDAIVAMIGPGDLPSEDYLTLCDHLKVNSKVVDLFGCT